MSKEVPEKVDVLDQDHPDYKHEDDEKLEDKIPDTDMKKEDADILKQVEEAQNPLDDESIKVPHFDDSTSEFIDKINKMPQLLPEHRDRLTQLDEDKRTVWILSHVNDDLYPIRLYKLKEPTKDDKDDPDYIPQYETEKVKMGDRTVTRFKTETNYYPYQSISPAAKKKIGLWEQEETNITMTLQRLQQKYFNVVTIRNLIDKLIEKDAEDKKKGEKARVTTEELKQYFKRLKDALDEIPRDFDSQIKDLQDKIIGIDVKRTKALIYEYMAMQAEEYDRCVFSDARDYLNVAQHRDKVKPPS